MPETAKALDLEGAELSVALILGPIAFEIRKTTSTKVRREGSWERTVAFLASETGGEAGQRFDLYQLEAQAAEVLEPHGLELQRVGTARVRRESSWERTLSIKASFTEEVQARIPLQSREDQAADAAEVADMSEPAKAEHRARRGALHVESDD